MRVHLSFYSVGNVLVSEVTMFILARKLLLDRQRDEQLHGLVSDNDTFDSF